LLLIIHSLHVAIYLKTPSYYSFGTPAVFIHTPANCINQTAFIVIVNPTIVTKLQFIRTTQNLFTSADEERRRLM